MESTPTLVMSSVVETSHQGDREISPCASLSRAPYPVMSSVVETSHEISPCAALSRDDSGMESRNREAMGGGCLYRREWPYL